MTSSGSVAIVAPVFSRRLVPSARGSSGWPGTANTSRPCSAAVRAVISVPDRRAASTISTPKATPEMMRLRRGKSCARGAKPGGILADQAAPLADLALQLGMLRRIDVVEAAGEHGDGSAAPAPPRAPHASMPRASPEAMTKPRSADAGREHAGELLAGGRGVAGADDGNDRARQVGGVALDVEERRRRIDGGKRRRIARLDGEEGLGADPVRGLELGLGRLARADADRLPPAAPRQLGQRRERRLRPAEVIDELAEGDGADVVAADQPEARQALGSIERCLRQRRRRQPCPHVRTWLPTGLTIGRQSCSPRRHAGGGCWHGAWRRSGAP